MANALTKDAYLWSKDLKDGYYNISVHKSDIFNLSSKFAGKIYLSQTVPVGLSSSPKIFIDFMKFPIWTIKQDNKNLYCILKQLSHIDMDNFRKDCDIQVRDDAVIKATIFNYLDDMLEWHKTKAGAQQRFEHSEDILKLLFLQTKTAKAKPPSQRQVCPWKLYVTVHQTTSLPKKKVDNMLLISYFENFDFDTMVPVFNGKGSSFQIPCKCCQRSMNCSHMSRSACMS